MASVNKVILVGNVGHDPEVRYVEKDLPVATFSLATTTRSYKAKNGTQIPEHTEWHRIVLWRGLAKIAEQYVKKGTPVYIEGKLQTRSWTDQQGIQHSVTEIVGSEMQLLGKKPGETESVPEQPKAASEPVQDYKKTDAPVEDDGLPF